MLYLFYLARVLVARNLKARFRRTFLGWLWIFIPPIVTILIFNVIRGVVEINSDGVPYLLFSTVGVVAWTFFTRTMTAVPSNVLGNSSILKKSDVSRELFPLVALITSFIDFAISLILVVGVIVYYNVSLTLNVLWLPLLIALLGILGLALGMIVAAVAIYRRDIIQGMTYLVQALLYISPILYPLSEVPDNLRFFYQLNPIVGLIENVRRVLILGSPPDFTLLAISITITLVIFFIGWPFYKVMSQYFADVL